MSFASHSHPDYRLEPEQLAAAPLSEDERRLRLEWLREQVSGIAEKPDAMRADGVHCPNCDAVLSITLGRNSGAWIITHEQVRGCDESGSLWRIIAADRETAIELWRKEVEE